MDETQFGEIKARLDALIRLLAINVAIGKTLKEQVGILSGAGLRPVEIARVLGKSQNYVNVTLHALRKETSEGARRRGLEKGPEEGKDESGAVRDVE